ncbi:hypothetical protein LguiB_005465 [Lonicera macranthoides]
MIFDFEGLKFGREHAEVMLSQLESMSLTSLREVTHIWRIVPNGIQGFHNLRSLTVSTCAGLRYILTPSVAKIVVNLQELILTCCQMVEEVINTEDEKDGSKIEMMDKVVLPQLHTLQHQQLDNITVFCGGKNRSQSSRAAEEKGKLRNSLKSYPGRQNLGLWTSGLTVDDHSQPGLSELGWSCAYSIHICAVGEHAGITCGAPVFLHLLAEDYKLGVFFPQVVEHEDKKDGLTMSQRSALDGELALKVKETMVELVAVEGTAGGSTVTTRTWEPLQGISGRSGFVEDPMLGSRTQFHKNRFQFKHSSDLLMRSQWLELTTHLDFVETMKAERIELDIQTQASLTNNYVSGGFVEKAEAKISGIKREANEAKACTKQNKQIA